MTPKRNINKLAQIIAMSRELGKKFPRPGRRPRPGQSASAPISMPQAPPTTSERLKPRPGSKPTETINVGMRLKFLLGCFMLGFSVLAARAVNLTVLQGPELHRRALHQYQKKITAQGHRGQFLDRRGHTLAISLPVRSLSVDIDQVRDRNQLADQLAQAMGTERYYLRRKLKKAKPGSFPIIARKLPPGIISKVQHLNNPALFFIPDMQRFYTMGEITSHILGFVGFDGLGAEGLEKVFQKDLQGVSGSRIITQDRMGRVMPVVQNISEARPGADIVLSIDATVQYIAYRALLRGVVRSKAKAGSVVIMDPKTGDVLAMVNQPAFNPNNMLDSQPEARRNRAILDSYEPGSTFKIFTIGAALDLGLVKETTVIDIENGRFNIGDRTIRDFHVGNPVLTVSQVIQKSSNVGAAKIGLMMKPDVLEQYILNFGFARPTGVEQTNETAGGLADITHYRYVGQANRSYGYGVQATPLQIITATTAAVNGGLLRPPHLVSGRMIDNKVVPIQRNEPKRVISDKTSATLRRILATVVSSEGTAVQAKVAGYTVAGKTGTARKASGRQGYTGGGYFASFVGLIPAEDPKIVIFVGIDEPDSKLYYGGLAAAPVFREIAEEILPLLAVLPTTPAELKLPPPRDEAKSPPMPMPLPELPGTKVATSPAQAPVPAADPTSEPVSYKNLSMADALDKSRARGVVPKITGSGKVVQESIGEEGELRLVLE
ncbi:MAG: penicillin-binding protein 2 [Magnetococcales bacterium]|nr:penicillin-binding protein 2 [Magnetococcales bacterium]